MTTITISPDKLEDLQKLADVHQVSIQELADAVLGYYIHSQSFEIPVEQLEEVEATIERHEARMAAGVPPITSQDMRQMLRDMIAEHKAKHLSEEA